MKGVDSFHQQVPKLEERRFVERLGHDVGDHVVGTHPVDLDSLVKEQLARVDSTPCTPGCTVRCLVGAPGGVHALSEGRELSGGRGLWVLCQE